LIENIIAPEAEAESTPKTKSKVTTIAKHPTTKVVPIVLKAMASIDQEGEWYHLGTLGSHINRAHPDFDSRTYGCAKLSDLLAKTGQFEVKKREGNKSEVRRKP
jgi:hypothetical protein